ncbi:MAG: hypothetical protein K2X46_15920 [Roseomonas sp.]|nr:hypothetical protein [Roseomonas sp.]
MTTFFRERMAEIAVSSDPERFSQLWQETIAQAAKRFPWQPAHVGVRRVANQVLRDEVIRRCVRLISMLHHLHRAGYQRIRISPGLAPSGCHWRGPLTFADNVEVDGFSIKQFDIENGLVAFYTSGQGSRYFDWHDADTMDARTLAETFVQRFPLIAERGAGRDWAYAGWLTDILGRAELGALPEFYADFELDETKLAEWAPPPPQYS